VFCDVLAAPLRRVLDRCPPRCCHRDTEYFTVTVSASATTPVLDEFTRL